MCEQENVPIQGKEEEIHGGAIGCEGRKRKEGQEWEGNRGTHLGGLRWDVWSCWRRVLK